MAVYNRKMFVNAPQQMKLNSRGTGITSGLVPMKPKRGLVNEPGNYAGENKDDELMSVLSGIMADQNMAQLQPYQETFERMYKNVLPSGGSNFQRNAPALLDFFSRVAAAGQGGQPLTGGESGPFLDTISRLATATPALANITPAPDMDEKAKQLAAQDTIGLFKDMVSAELTKKEDEGTVLGKGEKLVDADGKTIATGALDYELKEVDGNLIMTYPDPNNAQNIISKNVFKQVDIDPDSKVIKLGENEVAFYGGKKFYGKDTPNLIKSSSNQEIGYYNTDGEYVVVKESVPKEVEKEIIVPKGAILTNRENGDVIFDNSQIEKEVTVPAGAVYLNKETNEVLFDNSKESESKKQLIKVPPGTTVIDNNGKEIFKAEDTKDETKTIKVKSGDTVIDQAGNIIFEAPDEPEYINVPNNVRVVEMKDGVATTIVEAQDNTAKKDSSTAGERNVNAAFDQLLGQNKIDNQAVNFIKETIPRLASVFDSMNMETPFTADEINTLKSAYQVLNLESELKTEPSAQELLEIEEAKISLETTSKNIETKNGLFDTNYTTGFNQLTNIDRALPLIESSISGSQQGLRQNLSTLFDTFPVLKNFKGFDLVNKFIGDETSLATTETLNSINQMFTLLKADFFPGNLNQQEISILQQSVAQLVNSKQGQELIMQLGREKALMDMLPKQLMDEFLNTGKISYDGEEVFSAEFNERGILSVGDQARAQREINKIMEKEMIKGQGKFTEKINALTNIDDAYTIKELENLPAERKIYTSPNGATYRLVEEYGSGDGNFGVVGYANENGEFFKPDGSLFTRNDGSVYRFSPNSPVYGLKMYQPDDLSANDGKVRMEIFDLYSFRG
jgi:hypothetical protein|tara:strand:+ start:1811 stop:4357 length:2547 start_codon:yes stop_codon:yes gene_type:complete